MNATIRPLRALKSLVVSSTLFAAVLLAFPGRAAPPALDESQLPESLRSGYVGPIVGPADDTAYARGTLGLIRPSYGRASLYVAWRIMHLPVGAVAKESHRRQGSWLYNGPWPKAGEDEMAAWLKARSALEPNPPAVAPDYFRQNKVNIGGFGEFEAVEGQCGPDAFALASRMLGELVADTALSSANRRTWIADQDAVFARCTWTAGKVPLPAPPGRPAANAPARLKALNAYQQASALFYADDYTASLKAFDAIAAVPDHPMRPWAALGALRSILRGAVRDAEWSAAVEDAWTKRQLRGAAFSAAVKEPAARRNARLDSAIRDFDTRVRAGLADPTLAPVHSAMGYTLRRAMLQLSPQVPLEMAMKALDRNESNPYVWGALDLFQELYPKVSADRPTGPTAAALRKHPWFDFVVTVQGCADAPNPPDAAICAEEHAHAQTRWQETQDNAWLLATLMTARQPSAADLPAAEAARAVTADRPEWASLQFHAARVLKAQGRAADARAALDAVAASPVVHKRDRAWVESERRAY